MARDRDQLMQAIREHGDRRADALKTAGQELEAIAALADEAIEAGLPITEIARAGAVSRPTLYGLLDERR